MSFFHKKCKKNDEQPSTSNLITNDFKCNKDISFYIENSVSFLILKQETFEKLLALNNLWAPTPGYKFPTTGNRHLKFQYTWLLKYNWLCFSQIQNDAYCKVCIFFSLKQGGIALRGHKDGGLVACDEDEIYNDSNFRQLLCFRVDAGDQNLQNHLVTCSKNAMYTSWYIQKEIITACNSLMLQTLVHDINTAKSFTVLADETSDIANKEQLTLCVRYVNFGQNKLREDFLQFIEVKDVSGKALSDTILNNLQSMGIETKYLVRQGYDGAASMSGIFNGTQAYIRTKHPMALYIHCSSHCLNLAISSSCKIPDIRNCMGTMQTICNFFSYPKRSNVLLGAIKRLLPDEKSFKLKKFFPTKWVERHDAVILYYELQPAIISALEDISLWKDTDTSSAANQLLASIHPFKFQISMMILVKLFSISVSLSKFLQTENLDLENALSFAETTQTTLKDIRLNADKEFNEIFKSVEKICNTLEIAVYVPRVSGRQTHRTNVDVDTPESYYRVGYSSHF
ncbi:hypothetical protein QTP88_020447 [Uroleucon formosanum]